MATTLTIGTFNLNNLFSRFSFEVDLEAVGHGTATKDITQEKIQVTAQKGQYMVRAFKGKFVKAKPDADRRTIAARIAKMDVDVLAVQEVEDIETLRVFAHEELDDRYKYVVLVEGNDERLIDVGLLSKRPIGAVRSWRFAEHPPTPGPIFSRDLLEVEILNDKREVILSVFNTHLKSQFIPFDVKDPVKEEQKANRRRALQAQTIERIVKERVAKGKPFVVAGDMNDGPLAPSLEPLAKQLKLENGLAAAKESAPLPAANAPHAQWTHRFKPANQDPQYHLFDQIWLGGSTQLQDATIERRTKLTGDGSDHDPAWVTVKV